MLPSLFVSHGAPTLPLTDAPARRFLEALGADLAARHGRPEAILVASAHWETASPQISAPEVNETIHDFYGFPPALYEMRYPAPDADIKVAQLSLQTHLGPAHHLRLGAALAPLRGEGVLIVGSGSFTHDLSEFRTYRGVLDAAEPAWVTEFADWFDGALAERRIEDLVGYRRLAPFAVKNHPTDEHLLPLYVAMGAGGEGARAAHLHASATHGILRMDVYGFGDPDPAPQSAVMASAHHA
jgi:4,5-DOPA dioxygenase extradiol